MNAELTVEKRRALKSIATPMSLLFWGAAMIVLDFKVFVLGRTRSGIDLLPDWLGLGLVAAGVLLLAFSDLFEGIAETLVALSAGVFLALLLGTVARWFVPQLNELPQWTAVLLQLVTAGAVVVFCGSMADLSSRFGLSGVSTGWLLLGGGVVTLYTLPQLLAFLFPAAAAIGTLLAGLLLAGLALGMLAITRRMQRLAEGAIPDGRRRGGLI
jgi:hypothetical protein